MGNDTVPAPDFVWEATSPASAPGDVSPRQAFLPGQCTVLPGVFYRAFLLLTAGRVTP